MATAEEILAASADGVTNEIPDYAIDCEMRMIGTPGKDFVLGVEGDDNVNSVCFCIPRKYRNVDFSTFGIRINYRNAAGKKGSYNVTDATFDDDRIKFTWLVGKHTLERKGNVDFLICLREVVDGNCEREFNTTLAKGLVLEGLEPDEQTDDPVAPPTQEEPSIVTFSVSDDGSATLAGAILTVDEAGNATISGNAFDIDEDSNVTI